VRHFNCLPHNTRTAFSQYTEVETFKTKHSHRKDIHGDLKLTNIKKKEHTFTELQFESENQRQQNAIVIKQTNNKQKNNFPKGHLTNHYKYKNKIFNQDIVNIMNLKGWICKPNKISKFYLQKTAPKFMCI
jgi:hypothetical protein